MALVEQLAINCRDVALYRLICNVAPVEAANWLTTLIEYRNQQLTACLNLSCQV